MFLQIFIIAFAKVYYYFGFILMITNLLFSRKKTNYVKNNSNRHIHKRLMYLLVHLKLLLLHTILSVIDLIKAICLYKI